MTEQDTRVVGIDHERLSRLLYRFAGTLVRRYELTDVLADLAVETSAILGVEGAGVMLEDEAGALRFVGSSDPVLAHLERLQIEFGEGPCLLAYQTGTHVLAPDLRADGRFPSFGPHAVESGMGAVYSFPMRIETIAVGALNVYRSRPGPFTKEQVEAGHTLADVATVYISHARDEDSMRAKTDQLQYALDSRVVIEQAKGVLHAALDLPMRDAFEALRREARSTNRRVQEVARDVVEGRTAPERILG